jgi:hypothetical protein
MKHAVKNSAGGAGRISGRLQVEAQVPSVQGYDEPVKDVTPDQHVPTVCGNAAHRRQFVTLKTERDVINWPLGESAIVTAGPNVSSGTQRQLRHQTLRNHSEVCPRI